MRAWIACVVLAGGCLRETTFECRTNGDCGSAARCEPVGLCSNPDDTCPTRFRFDDSAGPFANQCVPDDGGVDAGIRVLGRK